MSSNRMADAPAPAAGERRPYQRSMDGWWRRDPFFMRYMAREATALIVALYAVVLLVGVVRGITVVFYPPAAEASMYILMALILLVRPRGLMGEKFEKFE